MLKKFLSITLLATMLVTNFSQAMVYADEPTEKKEKLLKKLKAKTLKMLQLSSWKVPKTKVVTTKS